MQWPNEKGQNDKQWSTKNYTGTLLFYFVHLEVVFPEIQVYFKMLEWSSSVL
jgi:hypothetical protein